MSTIDRMKNNEKYFLIIYNKFIIINIINLENNVAQVLGLISNNKK
jgi:hypothetical protein